MKSEISIVIITKNRKRELLNCIKSLKKQSFRGKTEIVVVDSSDQPSEIKEVKYIYNKNLGIASARNAGVKNSRYNLIAFIDDDCIVHKKCLKELFNSIGDNAGVGGAVLNTKTNIIGKAVSYIGYPAGGIRWYNKYRGRLKNTSRLSTCNCLYKKEAIQETGGFNKNLEYGTEDDELSSKIIKKGYSLIYNTRAIVYHKPRDNLISIFKWFFKRGIARVAFKKMNERINLLFLSTRSSFLKFLFIIIALVVFGIYGLVLTYLVILLMFMIKLKSFNTTVKEKEILLIAPVVIFVMTIAEGLGNIYGLVKS